MNTIMLAHGFWDLFQGVYRTQMDAELRSTNIVREGRAKEEGRENDSCQETVQ